MYIAYAYYVTFSISWANIEYGRKSSTCSKHHGLACDSCVILFLQTSNQTDSDWTSNKLSKILELEYLWKSNVGTLGHLWTWHFYTWNKKTILPAEKLPFLCLWAAIFLETPQVEYLPTEAAMANNRAHVGYLNMSHGSSPKPCMFSTRSTMDSKRLCRSDRGIFQVHHVTASTANIELATSSWNFLLLCYQYMLVIQQK